MTGKELLYVEDALGHEKFLQDSSKKTGKTLKDATLAMYITELEQKHSEIYEKFFNLL